MGSKQDEKLFQKDVVEFTRDLRDNKLLGPLRSAFKDKGFPADEVLCAGYLENEEGVAVGAIVTESGVVHKFEHHAGENKFQRFSRVRDLSTIDTYIDAIHVAVEFREELFSQVRN